LATKIRLKRLGKIRSPHYRIVVMDSRSKRDGQAIEEIGLYHPKNDPSLIRVNSERAQYWLSVGAQPTEAVVAILKRSGDWQKFTGEESPSGILPQPEPRDREAEFAKALAEDGNAVAPAISKARKKAEEEAAKATPETPAGDVGAPVVGASDVGVGVGVGVWEAVEDGPSWLIDPEFEFDELSSAAATGAMSRPALSTAPSRPVVMRDRFMGMSFKWGGR